MILSEWSDRKEKFYFKRFSALRVFWVSRSSTFPEDHRAGGGIFRSRPKRIEPDVSPRAREPTGMAAMTRFPEGSTA